MFRLFGGRSDKLIATKEQLAKDLQLKDGFYLDLFNANGNRLKKHKSVPSVRIDDAAFRRIDRVGSMCRLVEQKFDAAGVKSIECKLYHEVSGEISGNTWFETVSSGN